MIVFVFLAADLQALHSFPTRRSSDLTCRWHIEFASLRMLDDAPTRLFHQLLNFRMKTCPARERQHTLLRVKLRPVIRRGARLLNATDVVLSRPAFRRRAKGLCPGLMDAAQNSAELKC